MATVNFPSEIAKSCLAKHMENIFDVMALESYICLHSEEGELSIPAIPSDN